MTTQLTDNDQLIIIRTDEFCAAILAYADSDDAYMLVLATIDTMLEMQAAPAPLLAILASAFSGYAEGGGYAQHYREHEVEYLAAIMSTFEAYSQRNSNSDNEGDMLQ